MQARQNSIFIIYYEDFYYGGIDADSSKVGSILDGRQDSHFVPGLGRTKNGVVWRRSMIDHGYQESLSTYSVFGVYGNVTGTRLSLFCRHIPFASLKMRPSLSYA